MMEFQALEHKHWLQVKRIYEEGINTGYATFQQDAPEWDKWDAEHLKHSRIVAIVENEVAGWAALTPVSGRCVYAGVAEVSVYVAEKFRGKKIGNALLEELIKQSEANNLWTLQAGIFPENTASVKIHEANGFRIIGYREKIGQMNGIWRDNLFLEKRSKIVGL